MGLLAVGSVSTLLGILRATCNDLSNLAVCEMGDSEDVDVRRVIGAVYESRNSGRLSGRNLALIGRYPLDNMGVADLMYDIMTASVISETKDKVVILCTGTADVGTAPEDYIALEITPSINDISGGVAYDGIRSMLLDVDGQDCAGDDDCDDNVRQYDVTTRDGAYDLIILCLSNECCLMIDGISSDELGRNSINVSRCHIGTDGRYPCDDTLDTYGKVVTVISIHTSEGRVDNLLNGRLGTGNDYLETPTYRYTICDAPTIMYDRYVNCMQTVEVGAPSDDLTGELCTGRYDRFTNDSDMILDYVTGAYRALGVRIMGGLLTDDCLREDRRTSELGLCYIPINAILIILTRNRIRQTINGCNAISDVGLELDSDDYVLNGGEDLRVVNECVCGYVIAVNRKCLVIIIRYIDVGLCVVDAIERIPCDLLRGCEIRLFFACAYIMFGREDYSTINYYRLEYVNQYTTYAPDVNDDVM